MMGDNVWTTSRSDPHCACGGRLVKHNSAGKGRYKDLPNLLICEKCWTAYNPVPHTHPLPVKISDPIDLIYVKSRRPR